MNYIKKIKCLIQQVNNILNANVSLDFDENTNTLKSTYANGSSDSTEIPIPKNTSELNNDGEDGVNPFITEEDLPTKTSELENDGENGTDKFITEADIPETIAERLDVSAYWSGNGFIFDVVADNFPVNSLWYSATAGTVTLDDSDATLDRIDLIVAIKPVDDFTAGTVGKITGTPATEALVYPPDYDPDLYYVIREVYVKAASTQPDTVADILMYAENAGQPTEATVTENTGGLRINPADSITPITGTYSIGCADLESGDALTLTLASSNVIADLASFVFDLKINAYTSALHKNSIQVTFENASGAVAHIKLVDGDGFDASLIGVAQTIKIYEYNFYIFQKEDMSFDRVRFYFDNIVDGTDQMSLQLDNIDINLDSGESTPSNNYVTEANANNTPYVRINNQWSDLFNHIPRIGKRVEMGDSSNIDWSAGDTFTHNTLTAPLVLTESNLPARSGTKTISSYFTGEQPITVPANWIKEDDTDYDGTVMNRFVAECVNGNSGSELIYYSIKPMI